MENTEKQLNLFEKLVKGIADAVKVPLTRRALRVKFVSAYNDLLQQKTTAQSECFKELEKLDKMDMETYLNHCATIRSCDDAISDLKKGFKELFDDEMPEDL